VTQTDLDTYFKGGATDEVEIVEKYRKDANTPSHVSFKLVTVPVKGGNGGTFAYVLIRGTTNNWDMLTDAQLWSAAALMQVLRELLPLGSAWTPIMDQLIDAITMLESKSLQRVSFYRDTTAFVDYVKTLGYAGIVITGKFCIVSFLRYSTFVQPTHLFGFFPSHRSQFGRWPFHHHWRPDAFARCGTFGTERHAFASLL